MMLSLRSLHFLLVSLLSSLVLSAPSKPSCPPKFNFSHDFQIPPTTAIDRAAKVSTGNPSQCATGTKYFPQPVDHASFKGDWQEPNATFLHQYEVIDDFYRPGGPILFVQGVENAELLCLEWMTIPEWAKELGALAVALEHRYFGISTPYGLNYTLRNTWPVPLLKPLTLENVLLDSVSFVSWLKATYPGAKESKVIMHGGSYGGYLSILYRVHYPEIFHASIASSPPTLGLVSDPHSVYTLGFGDWANNVYYDYSVAASEKIKEAVIDLRKRLAARKFDGIQEALGLCSKPNSTSQINDIAYAVFTAYATNLQENLFPNAYPFYQTIKATLSLNDSLSIIGAATKIYNKFNGAPCLEFEPQYKDVDPYFYARCTYLPHLDGYSSPESIWGANLPDYSQKRLLDPWCKASFGIEQVDAGQEFQRNLGLDDGTIKKTKRLLVTGGMQDPVTGFGPSAFFPGQHGRNNSRVYWIEGAAHAAELLRANETDSEGLKDVRIAELNYIKEWLGLKE